MRSLCVEFLTCSSLYQNRSRIYFAHVHDHFIRVSLVKGMTIDAVLPAFFV